MSYYKYKLIIIDIYLFILILRKKIARYFDESLYIPNSTTFCALDWWRNNDMKCKILSKMSVDILAIPISTVAYESIFSVGGKVIDEPH
jgi:hypothetical protein